MSWVIENSRHKGSEFVVLLMIANHAHSDGTGAWPAAETLARESRITARHVLRIIPRLIASGELNVQRGDGPRGTNLYSLPSLRPLPDDKLSGATSCQTDKYERSPRQMQRQGGDICGPQMSPEPSLTVIREQPEEPKGAPTNGAPEARAQQRRSPAVFSGAHLVVSEKQDRLLGEAFPWADRMREYRKADAWLEAHPHRRPRRVEAFIHNWISKAEAPSTKRKGDIDAEERTRNNIAAAEPNLFPN
jgi:hypothetical protein